MFNLKKALALFITIVSMPAFSALHLEPYAGFGNYTTTIDAIQGANSDDYEFDSKSMTTVGGRIGYSMLLFSAGLDLSMDSLDSGTRTNTGLFVGADMPILVRAYAKYLLNSKIEDDDLDDDNIDVSFDSGYAIGVGFTGLPFLSINFEIEKSKYVYDIAAVNEEVDSDWASYTLSVSLPLDL